jgi:peptide/nickel transport system substrate-binding protein
VTIRLKSADSSFLDELASPSGPKMMSPTALAANAGTDHGRTYLLTHDVGTGPYVSSLAGVGDAYQLSAFPDYWGKKPFYTTVNIPVVSDSSSQQLQLDDGSLAAILHDIPSSAVNTYKANSKFISYTLPTTLSDYMYVNPHTPAMSDPAVRKALLQVIDIDALAKDAFFGRGEAS